MTTTPTADRLPTTVISSAGENWRRRWEEAMRCRASQIPATPHRDST
jgi:hypothetical protein